MANLPVGKNTTSKNSKGLLQFYNITIQLQTEINQREEKLVAAAKYHLELRREW